MRAEHWLQLPGDGIKLKKWDPFKRRALGAGSPTHLGFHHPFFLLWQGHTWSLLTLCVSVSKGSCSAAFSGMWVLWEPLTRLCSTKGWHRWSTLESFRVFWGLTQGSRAWGRCLHAPSAPQLQGLQPQTSLSALYQSHDKIILLPQDSTGDV